MFSLKNLAPRIWCMTFDSSEELAMTFLRCQEFYECPNEALKGHAFTIQQYKDWYVEYKGSFSYAKDWAGFNFPTSIIKQVIDAGIPDPNPRDALMAGILAIIGEDSYLIGITDDAAVQDHELTHAMYHVDDVYRDECKRLLSQTEPTVLAEMEKIIAGMGYADATVWDEIQTYMTTGDHGMFDDIVDTEEVAKLCKALNELHSVHFKNLIK